MGECNFYFLSLKMESFLFNHYYEIQFFIRESDNRSVLKKTGKSLASPDFAKVRQSIFLEI